jgi:hypothetical protein
MSLIGKDVNREALGQDVVHQQLLGLSSYSFPVAALFLGLSIEK